jgi:hypothetical protein
MAPSENRPARRGTEQSNSTLDMGNSAEKSRKVAEPVQSPGVVRLSAYRSREAGIKLYVHI